MPHRLTIFYLGLLWLLAVPFIYTGINQLLYLTIWNEPGYQQGEQFAPIWVILAAVVVVLLAAVTGGLWRKVRWIFIAVLLALAFSLASSFLELIISLDNSFQLAAFAAVKLTLKVLVLILLVLDRHSFFEETSRFRRLSTLGVLSHLLW